MRHNFTFCACEMKYVDESLSSKVTIEKTVARAAQRKSYSKGVVHVFMY